MARMNLRTYRAPSMAEALALVKRDLGKDAVILNTRSTRVGGVLGFFSKTVVEVTASDQGALLPRRTPPAAKVDVSVGSNAATVGGRTDAAKPGGTGGQVRDRGEPSGSVRPFFAAPMPTADPLAGLYARPTNAPAPAATVPAAASQFTAGAETLPVRNGAALTSPPDVPRRGSQGAEGGKIERELAAIRLMVSQVLQASPPGGTVDRTGAIGGAGLGMPESLFEHYLRLLESQMARSIVEEIVGKVRDELSAGELSDASIVRTAVLRHLSDLLPTAVCPPKPREPLGTSGGSVLRPHVIALIGPTGVGKTTTTAKLAAAFKLRHGRSVALITTDTYRIAAVDQLRTYANIIGLPLKVVMSPEEMVAALEDLTAFDVVLIDTAGRSQHNSDRLEELAAFLDAARPDETHLVLSCASSEQVLMRTAEAFAPARPSRILFSKLDEAVNFGLIVNVVRGVSERLGTTPVSYVTTGQEVPDHIEPGRADRLARMILDNRLDDHAVGRTDRVVVESHAGGVQAVGA